MKLKQNFGLQEIFFFLILIGLTVAFFNIVKPFLTDIFLTLILVILFQRPFRFFVRKFRGREKLAAGATLALVSVSIVIPLFFVGYMVTKEATGTYHLVAEKWPQIQQEITQEKINAYLNDLPFMENFTDEIDVEDYKKRADELISNVSRYMLELVQNTFTGLAFMLFHAFIILFLMFYMLLDGKILLNKLQYLIPMNDNDEVELFTNIKKVTDGIVINSFMLGVIEGVWGTLLLLIFEVPSPVFWGFIMALFSIIPLLGANTVMFPIAVIHLILGDYATGIGLIILGNGAFLINQNIIRPKLDSNKSGMHTAFVFLASIGGLFWLGIVGFLAGPLLTALFISVWNQYGQRYRTKLEHYNSGTEVPENINTSTDFLLNDDK